MQSQDNLAKLHPVREQVATDAERALATILRQSGGDRAIPCCRFPKGEEARDDNISVAVDVSLELIIAEDLNSTCMIRPLANFANSRKLPQTFPFANLGTSSRRMELGST